MPKMSFCMYNDSPDVPQFIAERHIPALNQERCASRSLTVSAYVYSIDFSCHGKKLVPAQSLQVLIEPS